MPAPDWWWATVLELGFWGAHILNMGKWIASGIRNVGFCTLRFLKGTIPELRVQGTEFKKGYANV